MAQIYLLDANVFVEAARRYYAFDILPPFWDLLVGHAARGVVCSVDRVKDELLRGKDELAEWVVNEFKSAFRRTDTSDVVNMYRTIMSWVSLHSQFKPEAKSEFAVAADGWLIAYALVHGCTLVTHEQYEPNCRRKVKIPNVCKQFGVETINTFDMLRQLGVRFGQKQLAT